MSFGRGKGAGRRLQLPDPGGYRRLEPIRVPAGGYGAPRTGAAAARRGLWARVFARHSPVRHVDWVLVAVVLALSLLGTLLVWSATEPTLAHSGGNPRAYLEKQLLNVAIGIVLMVAVSIIDYRMLRIYAPFVYAVGCLGLLAVLSPLGSTVNGAHAWISLPAGFQVEPSEYAKIGLILMIAMILSGNRDGDRRPRARELAIAIVSAIPMIGLVVAEPALGVTIVLAAIAAGMIALSGIPGRWLVGLTTGVVVAGVATFSLHLLKAYQVQRLTAFLNPSADPLGTGYSAAQAKIAIGSGGMFGQGLFHGQLVAGNFVPSQQTDFIFTVAGEELGFVGTISIIVLLAVLLLRALRIASRADDLFGLLVASGVAVWFAAQSFVNIGMTIGIMPVTGLPLPFVSYGGSALFADMIAVGMLLAVHRRHLVFE